MELSQQPQGPLAEGQLHCCHVSLHNTGAMPLQDLRLAAAPTAVLLTQPHEAADSDPLAFLRGRTSLSLPPPPQCCSHSPTRLLTQTPSPF